MNAAQVQEAWDQELKKKDILAGRRAAKLNAFKSKLFKKELDEVQQQWADLVCIAEGDEWKTAFQTRYGSFEWHVIPFGLTNAPTAFQRFVNDIFADMLDISVVVYFDDILIYSNNPMEHREHVHKVLCRLRANKLYCKGSKCEFHWDSVEYLGYILSPEGLCMSKDKVKAILDWPVPQKVKDIQSFLGFANFYHCFIHEYSDIVIPLICLTHKGTQWKFNDKCMAAFNELKQAFTHTPILTHWVPDQQLVVETNTSDYAIAAILSICLEDGEIHLIAFLSQSLHIWCNEDDFEFL